MFSDSLMCFSFSHAHTHPLIQKPTFNSLALTYKTTEMQREGVRQILGSPPLQQQQQKPMKTVQRLTVTRASFLNLLSPKPFELALEETSALK